MRAHLPGVCGSTWDPGLVMELLLWVGLWCGAARSPQCLVPFARVWAQVY